MFRREDGSIRGERIVLLVLVLAACAAMYQTARGKSPDNAAASPPDASSLREIAGVMEEMGITGITEELLPEIDKVYAGIDPEVIFPDRATLLLSWLGAGEYDPDTREWTPPDTGVYSFDTEVVDEGAMYTDFLRGVSAASRGALEFTEITEDLSGIDPETGTGRRTVSFVWNGQTYTFRPRQMGDWFDTDFANDVNELLLTHGCAEHLYFTTDGYQTVIVLYGTRQWAEEFSRRTGCELSQTL